MSRYLDVLMGVKKGLMTDHGHIFENMVMAFTWCVSTFYITLKGGDFSELTIYLECWFSFGALRTLRQRQYKFDFPAHVL